VDLDEGLWSSGVGTSEPRATIGSCSWTYEKSSFSLALPFFLISEAFSGVLLSSDLPGELAMVLEGFDYLVDSPSRSLVEKWMECCGGGRWTMRSIID
jgi:hypothetical protein